MTATDLLLDPTPQHQEASAAPMAEQSAEADTPPVTDAAADPDTTLEVAQGRIDALDDRLTGLTGDLGATGQQLGSVLARLEAVEASQTATADRVAAVDSGLGATGARLDSAESRLTASDQALLSAGEQTASNTSRLVLLNDRLDAVDERIAALQHHAAAHDRALQDITRTIAAEVERHTSDALVDSRHSLQLAVNSIAQLALAMAESSRDITEDVSAESAAALLDSFRTDLDAILAQLGFESLDTSIGSIFDPHRHRALKRVPTSDAAQDKSITRVIRDGYSSTTTGRILLFADVEVSRYSAP